MLEFPPKTLFCWNSSILVIYNDGLLGHILLSLLVFKKLSKVVRHGAYILNVKICAQEFNHFFE